MSEIPISTHGSLNGHAVGIILKELVRRAIITIRAERQVFEVSHKAHHATGDMTDVLTSADRKAQQIYVRSLRECFPDFGIIGEEDALSLAATGSAGYFTVDPLDGTKAFIRRQSHGVGTMIAMVENGRVSAAYVGDINTQEIYGFRPGSLNVNRISEFETAERLVHQTRPIDQQFVLLRDPEAAYSSASRKLIQRFKSCEIEGGSIGIWLARLWKREVAAALMVPSAETPWDSTPILGISERLGYHFYRPAVGEAWQRWQPELPRTTVWRDHDLLVVHRDDAPGLGLR